MTLPETENVVIAGLLADPRDKYTAEPPITKSAPGVKRRHSTRLLSLVMSAVTALSFAYVGLEYAATELAPSGYTAVVRDAQTPQTLRSLDRLLPSSLPEIDAKTLTQPSAVEVPEGSFRIVEYDFSGDGLSNETKYSPDLESLLELELPFISAAEVISVAKNDSPEVLIIHTHGSEAYADDGQTFYHKDSGMRSTNITENVVAVGGVIAETLRERGISVLHVEEMFDAESYYNSYNRSLEAVKECLRDYPSIKYVIDVHRDAASSTEKMVSYKPLTTVDGEKCAQLMLVVGSDYLGAKHPDWETNLSLALKVCDRLRDISPKLVRPINLRGASFNQQYSPGFMLLEVGSCANTLSEAKRSAVYFAESLADIIG